MKVHNAMENYNYLKSGIPHGDVKNHTQGKGVRRPENYDRVEISDEARVKYFSTGFSLKDRVKMHGYSKSRVIINEVLELKSGDFLDLKRSEMVNSLKESIGAGRYDFNDHGVLGSSADRVLSNLL